MSNLDINPAAQASEIRYRPALVMRESHAESRITRLIEQQTAKIPSGAFLFAALSAMAAAVAFEATNHVRASRFIGMWAAPLLVMGVYNKLVKTLHPG
ncbi:MAG TPA: hypothetical protein VNZ57_09830 [Longimicrobiales bacterium]|nr:hypothetical protein [Longimicrobiales bacterium]